MLVERPDHKIQARLGTRFLVYPQPPFIPGYEHPEVVWLSPSPGSIIAGPADNRMYVVRPVEDKAPYSFPDMPPYAGATLPPAEPGYDGHFDHISPDSHTFLAAHVYACVRRVLDVCEGYRRQGIPWYFFPVVERLEIVPRIRSWDNAHSGFGYLEMGESDESDRQSCYGLSFDAVAHEVGHLVLLNELGLPIEFTTDTDFAAYHEAVADFISLLGLLHFDTALDRILRRSRGNLLIHSELDRIAEQGDEKQIRSFNHSLRMSDVGADVHDRSKPFAAALFDCVLEVHQSLSFQRGLSPVDPRRYSNLRKQMAAAQLAAVLNIPKAEYEYLHLASKAALQEARDIVGESLVRSWQELDPNSLTFTSAAISFLATANDGRGKGYVSQFEDCFRWREII